MREIRVNITVCKNEGILAQDILNNYTIDEKKFLNLLAGNNRLIFEAISINTRSNKNIIINDYLTSYLHKLRNYDDCTYSHSINVAFYAMMIGKWLCLSENELYDLIQTGLLHDIGKIKIPKCILNKRSSLTSSEFAIMKQHSYIGYDMLNETDIINSQIKEAILMHHERFDGSGYPIATTAESISQYAKIIAVADAYDAMTSNRPYKKRFTPFEAFRIFSTKGANQYDSTIVRIFKKNIIYYLVNDN